MTPSTHDKEDGVVTLDQIFSALSHSTRRHILTLIGEHNPRKRSEFEPEDLLESIEERERRHLQLYHTHLPALDEAGFIDWDQETDTIRRGPRYEEIRPLIQLMHDHQDELPDDWP